MACGSVRESDLNSESDVMTQNDSLTEYTVCDLNHELMSEFEAVQSLWLTREKEDSKVPFYCESKHAAHLTL